MLCCSSRSLPKSRRKERALALCKVTYIAARARETERNVRIVLATRIFAMVHRSSSVRVRVSCPAREDGSVLAGEPRRFGRKRRRNGGDGLILMENRHRFCVCVRDPRTCSRRRRDVISRARARAIPTRSKYVRERRGAIVVLMERIACSTV